MSSAFNEQTQTPDRDTACGFNAPLAINKTSFTMGISGAMSIVAGRVLIEDFTDVRYAAEKLGISKVTSTIMISANNARIIGGLLFISGWAVILAAASVFFVTDEECSCAEVSHFDNTWGYIIIFTGVAVFLFAFAGQQNADKTLFAGRASSGFWLPEKLASRLPVPKFKHLYGLLFIASFFAFTTSISFKTGAWDSDKFIFGIIAAFLMLFEEVILMFNRAANIKPGSGLPHGHVYNWGLPLFAVAWVFIVLELSLE